MANLWRASKSRLVKKIVEAPNDAERLKLRPDNIKTEVDWKAFVREKLSADFKVFNMLIFLIVFLFYLCSCNYYRIWLPWF